MAFVVTVTDRWNNGGQFYEKGTWVLSGGDTFGTLTPEYTGHGLSAGIREIQDATFGSDNNNTIALNYTVGRGQVRITTAANDTGEYTISGYGA